ncbi:MAG: hypothetical protein ACQEVA_16400 [Myxococcota bacterium]
MSNRTASIPSHLVATFALAGLIAAWPAQTNAQDPPPPPPPSAQDSEPSDDEQAERRDAPAQDEAMGEDGLPAPPTPEELEGGVAEDPDDSGPPAPQREELTPAKNYDNQHLRIERTQGDPITHQFRYGTAMISVRGTFGSIVDPPDFYEKVGRPDLAKKYQRRSTARVVFLGSSVILGSVGSYAFAVAGAATEPFCFGTTCTPQQQRQQRTANVLYGLSAASLVGGLVGFFGTLFWSAHPVGVDERRALADDYNESLRRDLGLPSDHSARHTRPPVELRLGGAPVDGGAMGVLTLEF